MRFVIVMVCYLAGTLMALRSVAYASSLFLWNNIFQPLAFARRNGELPVAYFVLAVLVASYAFNLARGTFKPKFGVYFLGFSAILLWLTISAAVSQYPKSSWEEILRLSKFLLPLLLIYSSINRVWEVRVIAGMLAASLGIWAAQAGIHCLSAGVTTDLGIPDSQLSDRNDFTAGIVGTLPILFYFAGNYRYRFRKPLRGLAVVVILLSLVAIVLSDSRGASVGLGMTGLAYVFFISRKKMRDLFIGMAAVGIILLMLPASWYARMSTIEIGAEQTESSAAQRSMLMAGAWRATTDHPVFGLGPDGWFQVVSLYGDGVHNPHSIYLKLSAETGFVGLALYLAMMAFTFFRVKARIDQARRQGDVDGCRLGTALIMNVIGLLSAMTFLNSPFSEYLWAWISLCHAFAAVYRPPVKAKAGIPSQGPGHPLAASRA